MAQTYGQFLLNDELPAGERFSGQLTKKKLHAKLMGIARADPASYGRIVQGVKRVGDIASTYEGISVGLDDIQPEYQKRKDLMSAALKRVKAAKTDSAKQKILNGAQDEMQALTATMKGDMATMIKSGGRGNINQLMKAVTSPVAAGDRHGGLEPWLITRSYAEGLRPDELWVANGEARRNAISSKESVSVPGAFGKVLMSSMTGETVTEHDCGTNGGIKTETTSSDLQGRHVARKVGGVRRNDLISEEARAKLVKAKVKDVWVRSPLTCQSAAGVCQMCYGLDEWNRLPKIGTNLGIRSAQALTAPLTQFAMNARHGVRLAGGDAEPSMQGVKGISNFLEFPKSFMRKAAISQVTGTVSSISEAPQGGWDIKVSNDSGEAKHYAAPGLGPIVAKGAKVTAGDALSRGLPLPNEVVAHKGLSAGRVHIADKVNEIYKTQGRTLDKRHSELLAKAHLGYVRVTEDRSGENVIGSMVKYNQIAPSFAKDTESVSLSKADGRVLGEYVLHYGPGTEISKEISRAIKREGISEVVVSKSALRVAPVIKPLTRNPLLDPDWMAKMSHRYLRKVVGEAAAEGAVSEMRGTHPIPAYAYGADFGTGSGGTY